MWKSLVQRAKNNGRIGQATRADTPDNPKDPYLSEGGGLYVYNYVMTGGLKQGVQRSDWIVQGLCSVESDPFTRSILDVDACKSICQRCPVMDLCLAYAIANDERYGVWGATTPKERRERKSQMDVSNVPLEFRDHYLQMEGRVKRSAPTFHYKRNPDLDIVIDPGFLAMLDSLPSPYPDPMHQ